MRTTLNEAILRSVGDDGRLVWLRYRDPIAALVAYRLEDVRSVIAQAERHAEEGRVCVGYIAYEAACAFDSSFTTHPPVEGLPLACFGVFRDDEELDALSEGAAESGKDWSPAVTQAWYESKVAEIRRLIGEGDLYQANFTTRMSGRGCYPEELFQALAGHNPPRYAAFLDLGRFAVCSASPELFLHQDGGRVCTRPMKGTMPRGRFPEEDARWAEELQASEKNRAENLMIVDMARNDLGRIARTGTVAVDELFVLERYSTVWQLTSTVSARTDASLVEIFRALFPAASITGAPKKRAMEVIADLEDAPRGIYTGAIGSIGPGRKACFNVAIRTAVLDREEGAWSYGIGGGIVWDSVPAEEYQECLSKARILAPSEPFSLIETIRWTPGDAMPLLGLHRDRMLSSARFFDFELQEASLVRYLEELKVDGPVALRLLCDSKGRLSHETRPLPDWPADRSARIALAHTPVDSEDKFLFHKTTVRSVYDRALMERPGFDEVLLVNQDGFVTEGTRCNLAVKVNGRLITPPIGHGLLPGVMRRKLLEDGEIEEGPVHVQDLRDAGVILLFNALRGIARAELAD